MAILLRAGLGLAGLSLGLGILGVPSAALGDDTNTPSTVAGITAAEARLLAKDPSLRASADGTLYAVDEWQPPAGATSGGTATAKAGAAAATSTQESPATAAALADAFTLHSLPGAPRTIYLDFDGGSLLGANSWLAQGLSSLLLPGLSTLLFSGWSIDGYATFSDAELAIIKEVWARVAEDYSAWNVDVTTQEPVVGSLWRASSNDQVYGVRVAFTNDTNIQAKLCNGSCGGISWIGTFNAITNGETRSPAWVFPSSLGNKAKNLAEAASHEAGHSLGLSHDGSGTSGYYAGNSLWGPIMGSPYSSAITQWSRGDYVGANNREDDLGVLATYGLPPRVDEAGSTPATAAALTTLPNGDGVISSPTDSDWYALTSCIGGMTASASPADVGPNLDIMLSLYDSAGRLLMSNAPATSRTTTGISGMGASLATPLVGGPYYLAVSSAGSGSGGASSWSSGGYDSYGSIGTYHLAMAGCAGGSGIPVPPPDEVLLDPMGLLLPETNAPASRPGRLAAPMVRKGARGGKVTISADWGLPPAGTSVTGYGLRAFRLSAKGKVLERRVVPTVAGGTTTGVVLTLPRKGRWAVSLRARNELGWGPYSARSAGAKAR